jgi:hypothetical protein
MVPDRYRDAALSVGSGYAFACLVDGAHAVGTGSRSATWRHAAWLQTAGDPGCTTWLGIAICKGFCIDLVAGLLPMALVVALSSSLMLPHLVCARTDPLFAAFLSHDFSSNSSGTAGFNRKPTFDASLTVQLEESSGSPQASLT